MKNRDINEANRKLIRRYLGEVLDGGNFDLLGELFTADCIIHRPEFPEPIIGLDNFRSFLVLGLTTIFCRMETTIHKIICEQNFAACQLQHRATFCDDVEYPTPTGSIQAGGKTVEWPAMAMCRFEKGRVAEEWVQKGNTPVLSQLGYFTRIEQQKE